MYYKRHETLPNSTPIHIYISSINNRLVIKRKDGYKLDIQTPETMKLFGNTNELIDKTKNGSSFSPVQFSRKSISTKVLGIIYFDS